MVNWFRTNEKGEFAWPGFGDNARVLKWIIARCEGRIGANDTPLGWIPQYQDIDWTDLDFSPSDFAAVTHIDKTAWKHELAGVKEWFEKLGDKIPGQLFQIRERLEQTI